MLVLMLLVTSMLGT